MSSRGLAPTTSSKSVLANPIVFFLDDAQHEIIEKALSLVCRGRKETTKAARKAAALTQIARAFTERDERHVSIENKAAKLLYEYG
jgi:hypothetical protein